MHPYVYYLENKIKKSDREAFEAHMKIETNIDTYFINCYKGFLPQSVYSSMFFKRDKAAQTQISKIFKKISKDVFSNNFSEKSFYRAFFNFRFDIANLSRPNVFVRLFLNSSKNLKQFNEIRLKFEMETDFDYPNENKAVWQSPFSNESFDYSVQELFELALNKAKEFFSADFDKNKIKELVKSNFSGRSI